MKISVTNGVPVGETEQFSYLKECGFDAVDFNLGKYFGVKGIYGEIREVTDAQIQEHFSALRQAADAAGIVVGQTHSPFTGHPLGYASLEDIIDRQIAGIKATHYLGCKYCVIHPIITPGRRYDLLNKESFEENIDFYRRLIPALEEYGVYACLENMWVCDSVYRHICPTIFSRAEEMVAMCEVLGECFRICVDVGHGPLTQDDPAQMVRICGEKLACLHVHDNDGFSDLHTFPFAAFQVPYGLSWKPLRIDWADFMKALDEVDYQGTLSFEMSPPGPPELNAAGLRYLAEIAHYLISLRK